MNEKYYVDWTGPVSDALALIWAVSIEPHALVWARNAIQHLLESAPHKYGTRLAEGLFKLVLPPLQVYFSIDSPNQRVEIIQVDEVV